MPYPYPMMEDSDPRRNVSNTSSAYAQQPYATAATTYAYAYPYEYKYAGNPNSAGNPSSTGNPNSTGSSNGLSSSVTLLGDSATPSLYQDSLVHPLKFDSYADVYGRAGAPSTAADFAAMPQPAENAAAGPGTAAEWWRPPSQGAYGVAMQMQMPLSVAQYGLPPQQPQQQQPQQYTAQYAVPPQYSMVPVGMGLVYPEATAGTGAGPGAARNYVATSMGGSTALLPAKAMSPPAADEPRSSARGRARGGARYKGLGKAARKGSDAGEAPAVGTAAAGADAADALTTYDEAQKFKYGCKLCGKRFKRPSSLKTHTNIHTGFRPFVCPYKQCEKAFNAKSNMLRHYKLHFKLRSGAYILPNGQISMEKPTSKQLFGTKQ